MPCTARRRLLLAPLVGAAPWAQARVAPTEVHGEWPQARLVGSGRLRFIGLNVYDARLWAPGRPGPDDWATQALALELLYARSLKGALIAERSLQEMQRQGPIDRARAERWLDVMKGTFPDVHEGDRLTGLYRPAAPTRFFLNGALRGEWNDEALSRQFFGIWLAPQTSEPALREALFGGRA